MTRRIVEGARREVGAMIDEWRGVHYRWWILTLAGVLGFLLFSYFLYTRLGWEADRRQLPNGSDWLLRRIPPVNVLPVLSYGWFGLHLFAAGAALAWYPRRMPFLLFLLGTYMTVRSLFVFLSPIGAPEGIVDMRVHDAIFSRILGTWTFQNEFIFSGHTSIPFLFFLFFETPRLRGIMLAGSLTMAVCVLLSRNHYTVDVLAAFPVSHSIFMFSEHAYGRWIRPLFQAHPSPVRH